MRGEDKKNGMGARGAIDKIMPVGFTALEVMLLDGVVSRRVPWRALVDIVI